MGRYDKVEKVHANAGGMRFEPGMYIAEVVDIRERESKKNAHSFYWIATFRVVEVLHGATPQGAERSFVVDLNGKFPDLALGDVKACLGAMYGIDPYTDEAGLSRMVTPQVCETAVTPAQPCRGKRVKITATEGKNGYVKLRFQPAGGATAPSTVQEIPPPPPATFPPAGWTAHPSAPGYYYRGQEVLSEAQLRAK